jgi:hypothetical protein
MTRSFRTGAATAPQAVVPAPVPGVAARDEEVRAAVYRVTAVERVNGRLKLFWGADDGHVASSRRFVWQVEVVLVMHVRGVLGAGSASRGDVGQGAAGPGGQGVARDAGERESVDGWSLKVLSSHPTAADDECTRSGHPSGLNVPKMTQCARTDARTPLPKRMR